MVVFVEHKSTHEDGGGHRRDVDQLLHLLLGAVPLVVEAGHVRARVVAAVGVAARGVRGGVGRAVLPLHAARVQLHDPVVVSLGPGAVTPERSPRAPGQCNRNLTLVELKRKVREDFTILHSTSRWLAARSLSSLSR